MRLDELIKSLESFKDLLKSNYGPKGSGQYTQADNQRRKSRNVQDTVMEGPNKSAKRYTSAPKGTAQQQAAREARQQQAASKKNPVKIYSKEELAAFAAKRGMKPSTKKSEDSIHIHPNGQWKFNKTGGFGSAMTVGGGGSAGMAFGSANKTDKDQ